MKKRTPENAALTAARKNVKAKTNYAVTEALRRMGINVTNVAVSKISKGTKMIRMDVFCGLIRIAGKGKFSPKACVSIGRAIDKQFFPRRK